MKHEKKLTQGQQEQNVPAEQQAQQSVERQFESVEQLLRHDALHTPVPPAIAHRLQESVKDLSPAAARAWWRRWLGPKTP